jgi:hypothetical protein
MLTFVPPRQVFQTPPSPPGEKLEKVGYEVSGFKGTARSDTGGMLSYFEGHPHPRKGFVYAEGVVANSKAKRVTLALFQPFISINFRKGITGFLESYLQNYIRLVDSLFAECERIPYLHYEYYCEFSKASWNFVTSFLRGIGISFITAHKVGLIVATMFEYDDAYRVPLQDILSETTKDKLLNNTRKEINKLLKIHRERDPRFTKDELGAANKLNKLGKAIRFLLFIPRIKRSFKQALSESNFEWFQYDKYDRYWALGRYDYNTFGRNLEDRKEEQIKLMTEFMKKSNPGKDIKRIDKEDGSSDIIIV